jgi:hypothetical protein
MTPGFQQPHTDNIASPLSGPSVQTSGMLGTLSPTLPIKTENELVDGLHWVSSSFASDLPQYPMAEPTEPVVFSDVLDPPHNCGRAVKKHLAYPRAESDLSGRRTIYGHMANSFKYSQELRRLRCTIRNLELFDHQQKEYVKQQLKACSVYLI